MSTPDLAEWPMPAPPTFEGRALPHPDEPAFDQGLQFDIETILDRRKVLKLFGYGAVSLGLYSIAACAPGAAASPSASASASEAASANPSTAASCDVAIPDETAGPFPGDGSNGPDILSQSGVVRADIRSSFGSSTTTAEGVPLTIKFAIQDLANGCAPIAGAAVYAWHCTRDGDTRCTARASRTRTSCVASRLPGTTES